MRNGDFPCTNHVNISEKIEKNQEQFITEKIFLLLLQYKNHLNYMDARTLNIGENIKKFRELKNMTRDEIADHLDITVGAYGKIERNETDITVGRLFKIAEILQVDAAQILNFDVSHIFNFNNPQYVQAAGAKAENMHFHGDEYREKYIKMLEEEVERLRNYTKK